MVVGTVEGTVEVMVVTMDIVHQSMPINLQCM